MRFGYIVGYVFTKHVPLALSYERFLPNNFSIEGTLGHILIRDPGFENEKYYLAEISIRRFYYGYHQRLFISTGAFFNYDNIYEEESEIALQIKSGYLWQWDNVFTSIESGFGPGYVKNYKSGRYKFDPIVREATWNLGFIF